MILSPDEIATLTGKTRRPAQRQVLAALGVPFKARPDGSLVVLRASVDVALGYNEAARARSSSGPQLRLPARA